jgi:hypothetical protein
MLERILKLLERPSRSRRRHGLSHSRTVVLGAVGPESGIRGSVETPGVYSFADAH